MAGGFPPSLRMVVASPWDPDAHYAKERATPWIGYDGVHLTGARATMSGRT